MPSNQCLNQQTVGGLDFRSNSPASPVNPSIIVNGHLPILLLMSTKNHRKSCPQVFKCPHCSFWASTASRFHVHIVGHLNKRPFQCSLCHYSSNWRWDITKHIRLKTVRDPTHEKAKVLLTDETGRRNYSKVRTHKPCNLFFYSSCYCSCCSQFCSCDWQHKHLEILYFRTFPVQ